MPIQVEARRDLVKAMSRYALVGAFGIATLLSLGFYYANPLFERARDIVQKAAENIEVVEIPQTAQQQQQAAPARPQVPIEATDEADIEDLTIENTELYETASVPVPDKVSATRAVLQEEEAPPMEFWMVEQKPELTQQAVPEYPEIARQAGLEGDVWIMAVVGTQGRVESVQILRGPPVFHEAAAAAAMKMRFTPAMQNDRPVRVKVSQRISFRLRD